jgi:hypothetical protein
MLPILPALLLLILQGPTSIEKMALDGRLPAALDAISRKMEGQSHSSRVAERADEAVLATLLAFSGDPDLSHALYTLLSLDQPCEKPARVAFGEAEPQQVHNFLGPIIGALPTVSLESQRSRDGPF